MNESCCALSRDVASKYGSAPGDDADVDPVQKPAKSCNQEKKTNRPNLIRFVRNTGR